MKSRSAALDGVRAIALIAVLAYHSDPARFRGGFLGVEVFFVLSGYLLTSRLLDEHSRTGRVDHRRYAARRIRRLLPAAMVVLFALLAVVPILAPEDAHRLRGDLISSIAGVTNWHLIADGSSYFDAVGRPPFVRHLWSLGVELQFCLICSFLAAWLARRHRRTAVRLLTALMAISIAAMANFSQTVGTSRAYYGTDTRLSALLGGVLLAVLLSGPSARPIRSRLLTLGSMTTLGVLFLLAGEEARLMYPAGFVLTQLATAGLIIGALRGSWTTTMLGAGPVRWLGERAYGIYLWHWPIVLLLRPGIDVSWSPAASAIVAAAAAIALGAFSYRNIELPFIRGVRPAQLFSLSVPDVRQRFAAAMAAVLLLTGLALRIPTSDPIAASLVAGEKALKAQAVPTFSPPSETPSQATKRLGARLASSKFKPSAVAAPLPPPLRTFRQGSTTVTALGDSVMVGGAPALHEKLGASGYIDAKKNRRFAEARQIAHELRAQGRLGRVVIVHLGNNGVVRDQDIDALMQELADRQNVLLVTVRVNRPWGASVNETIVRAPKRHPTIRIVDWYGYSNGHPEWFHSDGTHLRPTGAENYAKLLAGSVPPPQPVAKKKHKPKPTPTPEPLPLPTLPA